MIIYTDGSGVKGRVNAAAVNLAANQISHQHLGSQIQYNVFAAELVDPDLAFTQWQSLIHQSPECYIHIHRQSGIVQKPWRQSGQSIIADWAEDALNQNSHGQVSIIWVPGHSSIEGNERADEEAKRAALDSSLSSAFIAH